MGDWPSGGGIVMTKTTVALILVTGILLGSYAFAGDEWTAITASTCSSWSTRTSSRATATRSCAQACMTQPQKARHHRTCGTWYATSSASWLPISTRTPSCSGARLPHSRVRRTSSPWTLDTRRLATATTSASAITKKLRGSSGKLRGDVTLFYVLKGAQYDKPFTVYLDDDSVKVTLPAP